MQKSLKLCVKDSYENQADYESLLKRFVWEGVLPSPCAFGWKFCTMFDNVGMRLFFSPCFTEGYN